MGEGNPVELLCRKVAVPLALTAYSLYAVRLLSEMENAMEVKSSHRYAIGAENHMKGINLHNTFYLFCGRQSTNVLHSAFFAAA